VLARQESPRWRIHKSLKETPESSNKADDNADLLRLSGRSRYGPEAGSDADAMAGTAMATLAVAARRPLATTGLGEACTPERATALWAAAATVPLALTGLEREFTPQLATALWTVAATVPWAPTGLGRACAHERATACLAVAATAPLATTGLGEARCCGTLALGTATAILTVAASVSSARTGLGRVRGTMTGTPLVDSGNTGIGE
jgi:hypothetical protein